LRNPPRILVVDDNPTNLEVLRVRLNSQGYEVVTAVDGEDALVRTRELEPDLVLLDVMMPKLDGFEVLSALKQDDATAHIPVLVLSNLGQERDVAQAKALGALAFLVKANLSLQDLVDRVDAALATGKP